MLVMAKKRTPPDFSALTRGELEGVVLTLPSSTVQSVFCRFFEAKASAHAGFMGRIRKIRVMARFVKFDMD